MIFRKTRQRINKKNLFGLQVIYSDNNQDILKINLVGDNYSKTFTSKESITLELKENSLFKNAYIFASDLQYNFIFDKDKFDIVSPEAGMLCARTYFDKNEFTKSSKFLSKTKKKRKSLEFIDSDNFHKLTNPCAENVLSFMKLVIRTIETLGGTFKMTIASSSLSLYKNRYLNFTHKTESKEHLRIVMESFYGGRCEAFTRGYFHNVNLYDFNSLYPGEMEEQLYPDPNSMHTSVENISDYIMAYEGTSKVKISIPKMKYPPLPHRTDKVRFPIGTIEGRWPHNELRHALDCGCTILHVYDSIFYTKTMRPFQQFIRNLYKLRLSFQSQDNPMEFVIKLLMNGLYGKFGEKFDGRKLTIREEEMTKEFYDTIEDFTRNGNLFNVVMNVEPKSHCIPIWSVYIAAYGRIKLHKELVKHNALYCDTDSLITNDSIETSKDLGKLKLEMHGDWGIVVRPKVYTINNIEEQRVKIKGFAGTITPEEFKALKFNNKLLYKRTVKYKEAERRGFLPNEIINAEMKLDLEDDKRIWEKPFSMTELQESSPIHVS